MSGWVDAITSPLKAASDVTQGLIGIRDTVKFGEAVIKLQSQILAAQQGALAAQMRETELVAEIGQLNKKVAEAENWEAQKRRYKLEELPPGVFVYTLNAEMADGEPAHSICQTCFQRGKKSILHRDNRANGMYQLDCRECGSSLRAGTYSPPRPAVVRGRNRSWMGS